MCCLYGWKKIENKVNNAMLRDFSHKLGIEAMIRGTDATGVGYVSNDKVVIYKKPVDASKLILTYPKTTKTLMGHTRMATKGSETLNYNNHPFRGFAGTHFALAHNGVLYNDTSLKRTKHLPETEIQTDSYVAVQLLEQSGALNFESLKEMAEAVSGSFVFTVLDENNTLYFVKGSNPICIMYSEALGLYVYASTYDILTRALTASKMWEEYEWKQVPMKDGDIMSIDRNGNIATSAFSDSKSCGYSYYDYGYGSSCSSDSYYYGDSYYRQGRLDDEWYDTYSANRRETSGLMSDDELCGDEPGAVIGLPYSNAATHDYGFDDSDEEVDDLCMSASAFGYGQSDIFLLLNDNLTVSDIEEMIDNPIAMSNALAKACVFNHTYIE